MINNFRIKLTSTDNATLDIAMEKVLVRLKKEKCKIKGPIPLPVKISTYTVNKSPHVYKKSREQFFYKEYSRIIVIDELKSKISFDDLEISNLVELKIIS